MNDLLRYKLCEFIRGRGAELARDQRRCEALLRDHCLPEQRHELFALVSAMKEGIVTELLSPPAGSPPGLLVARLTLRLQDQLPLTPDACAWAVESWALALGVIAATRPGTAPDSAPPRAPTRKDYDDSDLEEEEDIAMVETAAQLALTTWTAALGATRMEPGQTHSADLTPSPGGGTIGGIVIKPREPVPEMPIQIRPRAPREEVSSGEPGSLDLSR